MMYLVAVFCICCHPDISQITVHKCGSILYLSSSRRGHADRRRSAGRQASGPASPASGRPPRFWGSATCEGLGPRWVPQRPLRCCSYPSPQQAPHPAHHRRPTQRRRRPRAAAPHPPVSVPGSPPRFSSSSTTLVRCTFHRKNAGRSSRHSGPPGSDDLPVSAAAVLLAAHSLMPASVRPCHSRGRPRAGHNDVAYNNRSADGSTAGRKIISPNIDVMADTGIKLLHYCEPRQSSFPPSSPTLNAAAAQPQQTDSNPCCCCCVCCCAQTCSRSARRLARLS